MRLFNFGLFLSLIFLVYANGFGQQAELVVQSGHYAPVKCIAFHPQGKILASGSEDKNVIIWVWDND